MVLDAIASARSAAAFASLAACSTRLAAACAAAAACCDFWLAASAREAAWSARFAALIARCAGSGSFDEQPVSNERANTAPASPTSFEDFLSNPSILFLLGIAGAEKFATPALRTLTLSHKFRLPCKTLFCEDLAICAREDTIIHQKQDVTSGCEELHFVARRISFSR